MFDSMEREWVLKKSCGKIPSAISKMKKENISTGGWNWSKHNWSNLAQDENLALGLNFLVHLKDFGGTQGMKDPTGRGLSLD